MLKLVACMPSRLRKKGGANICIVCPDRNALDSSLAYPERAPRITLLDDQLMDVYEAQAVDVYVHEPAVRSHYMAI